MDQIIWQTYTGGTPKSPSVSDGIVFVNRPLPNNQRSSAIIGLDAQSGEETLAISRGGQHSSGSRVTLSGPYVLAESGTGFDLNTWDTEGAHQWYADMDQQSNWVPAADETNAYVYLAGNDGGARSGALHVWDLESGAKKSTILHPRSESNSYKQSVVLGTTNNALAITNIKHPASPDHETLVNFDIENMSIAWEYDGDFRGLPAVANGIVAVSDDDILRILDEHTGNSLWTWNGGYQSKNVFGNVALTDQYVFVNSSDIYGRGSVYAIDLETREEVWNSQGILGNVAIDGSLLVITNIAGVYAFGIIPEPVPLTLLFPIVAVAGLQRVRRPLRP